jgi:hypothetical protein
MNNEKITIETEKVLENNVALFSVLCEFMDKMLKWRDNQIARSAIHV